MKKYLLLCILIFGVLPAFCQDEMVTEEKGSGWILVLPERPSAGTTRKPARTAPPAARPAARPTAAVAPASGTAKPAPPKTEAVPQDPFKKTNEQVKRFQKRSGR